MIITEDMEDAMGGVREQHIVGRADVDVQGMARGVKPGKVQALCGVMLADPWLPQAQALDVMPGIGFPVLCWDCQMQSREVTVWAADQGGS